MDRRKLLQWFQGMVLVVMFILGCGTLTSAPTLPPLTATPILPLLTATPTLTVPTKTPTLVPPTSTIETANQYADEYIRIVLDKTERMQELPKDFDKPPAEQGKEYIVLYLTVTEIRDVHITNIFGTRDNRPTLVAGSSDEYQAATGQVKGMQFSDPTDIRSPSELAEGAKCIFVFEVPKDIQPVMLKLIYSYKVDLEEEDETSVEFEIDL